MIFYVIPARKGSKGLPYKNRKLFDYTASIIPEDCTSQVIVTTDDEQILHNALEYGFMTTARPEKLSNDTASMKDVLLHVRDEFKLNPDDIVVLLYLTYPERTWGDVLDAFEYFDENRGLSLLCKKEVKSNPFLCMYEDGLHGKQIISHNLYRRQDYDAVFELSHFIFISEVWNLENLNNNLYNDDTIYFPIRDVHDIDYISDFRGFHEHCSYDHAGR